MVFLICNVYGERGSDMKWRDGICLLNLMIDIIKLDNIKIG